MEMVKAVGLKRYYDTEENEVRALDDVSLSIEEGEFLAIVGTSGSGKTTLLNLLGGLDIPTEGGVWIEGQSLRDMNNEERTVFRRKYIGFVFQQYNLVPILNIYENIVLPLRLDGAKIDDELLEEIVKFLGIKEKLGNLPKEYLFDAVKGLGILHGKVFHENKFTGVSKIHQKGFQRGFCLGIVGNIGVFVNGVAAGGLDIVFLLSLIHI